MTIKKQMLVSEKTEKLKFIGKKIKITRYEKKYKELWDAFIAKSKNGTFLFYRDYMEYHSDRYTDFSLMFFDDDRLIAVIPANIKDGTLFSHAGLTYGGIVSDQEMKVSLMIKIFDSLKDFLKTQSINKLNYKVVPHIYHTLPAEEDLYSLYLHKARLIRRDVASTIFLGERAPLNKGTKSWINKNNKNGLEVKRSYEFSKFISLEEEILKRKYGIKPVHTAAEIQLLASKFPENIKLFVVNQRNDMIAGTIIYETKNVAHAQYSASNIQGQKLGASHFLFGFLINEYYKNKRYFDFGISTENNGRYLNHGLICFKERFGARATTYDFYEMDI
jgi:hypothetical protein